MPSIYKSINSFFPSNRGKGIKYTKTSLPVILAALIFALNSFVDNFMATGIKSGNQALSYANTGTTIVNGIIASTTIIGSSIYGQYYGTNNVKKIQEVIRGRIIIAMVITICFVIPALIIPEQMIHLASGFDEDLKTSSEHIMNIGKDYLRIISISGLLSTGGYTMAMVLRESGYGLSTLISSIICLAINIILNAIFIVFLKDVLGPLAISTIISLLLGSLAYFIIYIWKKDKRLLTNPLKLFNVSLDIGRQFLTRIPSFLLFCVGSITVSIRYIFGNAGYGIGSISNSDYKISAANILGISGMFFNIFGNTFESINANVALFVGKELGNNNFVKAKKNGKELQGFHLIVALIMSLLLLGLSFLVPKMTFLTNGYKEGLEGLDDTIKNQAANALLENIKMTIWPLSGFMPFGVWYITKSRIISSGGRTNISALVDAIVGIISTCWIAIINFTNIHFIIDFPGAYTLFFIPDLILKVVTFEILYYKIEGAKNITLDKNSIIKNK